MNLVLPMSLCSIISIIPDPSRSYLVLFIQQLHKDQEEALLQMKYGTTTQHIKKGSQMFESIDMQTATSFLCEIITGSSGRSTVIDVAIRYFACVSERPAFLVDRSYECVMMLLLSLLFLLLLYF